MRGKRSRLHKDHRGWSTPSKSDENRKLGEPLIDVRAHARFPLRVFNGSRLLKICRLQFRQSRFFHFVHAFLCPVLLSFPSRGKRARARAQAPIYPRLGSFLENEPARTDYPLKIRSKALQPCPPPSVSLVGGRGVKTRGKTLVSCTRATTDRGRPLCFSNPGFDSRINSPSVHNSFTATPCGARRQFRMQNPRESKQSAGGDVCAVRFNNNPRALCCGVSPACIFSPFSVDPLPRARTGRAKSCTLTFPPFLPEESRGDASRRHLRDIYAHARSQSMPRRLDREEGISPSIPIC